MLLIISVTVIAAIMVVAVIALVPVLFQIRRTAREVEKILETARAQIAPLSHDLAIISHEVEGILQSIRRQVDKAEEGIDLARGTVVRLREFEEEILSRIEGPLLELATLVRAVSRGIETFFNILRR